MTSKILTEREREKRGRIFRERRMERERGESEKEERILREREKNFFQK